jgi:hypothetical protein
MREQKLVTAPHGTATGLASATTSMAKIDVLVSADTPKPVVELNDASVRRGR